MLGGPASLLKGPADQRYGALQRCAGQVRSYLTCGAPSSLDQDKVDGNEGRDEEEVTKAPFCV
jgi:hypothetical protein